MPSTAETLDKVRLALNAARAERRAGRTPSDVLDTLINTLQRVLDQHKRWSR